ncbi:MAG: hypothetical protein AB1531_00355 [Chloroflexota bacterium]
MRDSLYHFIVGALDLFLWGGELIGEDNLPQKGPAVFIANHLDATGPIACCCSIPFRFYPWSVGDMMDPEKAPAYLNWDFTERQLHLKPPLSTRISKLLTKLTVPMFWSLGCIPVYKGDYERMKDTLRLSMEVLRQGKFLLVFPEDPAMGKDETTGMNPFQHTFVRLGEKFHAETGERLAFYPLAIHQKGVVQVGQPVLFNPLNPPGVERQRLKGMMESEVRGMYLKLGGQTGEVGALTPERK